MTAVVPSVRVSAYAGVRHDRKYETTMLDPPLVDPLLVSGSCSLRRGSRACSATTIEGVGTSLTSLSDLTPVLPPTAQRRLALASLRSLRYGGLLGILAAVLQHSRSTRTLRRDGLRAAAELELGDCFRCFFIVTLRTNAK